MNSMKRATFLFFDRSMLLVMVLWLAPVSPALAALPQTPTESVRSTIEDVIRILTNEQLKQPDRLAERRQEIERIVRDRVSYEDMAKQALGLPWLNLEAEERQEFVDLFVQLLRDSFAGKIDAYADEHVLYLSELRDDHTAEVRTKLAGRKTDSLLNFRLVVGERLGNVASVSLLGVPRFEGLDHERFLSHELHQPRVRDIADDARELRAVVVHNARAVDHDVIHQPRAGPIGQPEV